MSSRRSSSAFRGLAHHVWLVVTFLDCKYHTFYLELGGVVGLKNFGQSCFRVRRCLAVFWYFWNRSVPRRPLRFSLVSLAFISERAHCTAVIMVDGPTAVHLPASRQYTTRTGRPIVSGGGVVAPHPPHASSFISIWSLVVHMHVLCRLVYDAT